MRYFLILFVSTLLIASCSEPEETETIDFFEDKSIPVIQKIERVLETPYLLKMGFNEEQSLWLQDYYSKRKYQPRWINDSILTPKGDSLKNTLERSLWFGIPENRVKITITKKHNWVEEEIILTARTALMLSDLKNGFLDLEKKKYFPENFVTVDYFNATMAQNDSLNFDKIFLKQGISDTNYTFIANKLHDFCSMYPLDTNTFDIETIKIDSLYAIPKTKKALISKGYLKNSDNDSLAFLKALTTFQKHNGLKQDGVIGKYTSWALNESTYNKVLRTALSMERLRKGKVYPSRCVRINLPEYLLRFYVHDSLKRIHHIVIGKTTNQTPQLESKIRNIIVFPYWKVPYSIASKEVLPAVKRNVGYLAKNNYKIYRNDHEVNPYGVNWKKIKENSFPYQIIQQPGPGNSLGIIKFEFHNNYSVYVHDTPSKSLFKTDVRSYSHGCMRCENPVDLAKTILDYDSVRRKRNDITADSLDSLLIDAKNFTIKLKNTIPIYVEYTTVVADREKIIFHIDIYRREEEYLKIMKD